MDKANKVKCIKSYKRAGEKYVAGKSYAVDKDTREAHEAYFGETLWSTKTKAKKGK